MKASICYCYEVGEQRRGLLVVVGSSLFSLALLKPSLEGRVKESLFIQTDDVITRTSTSVVEKEAITTQQQHRL